MEDRVEFKKAKAGKSSNVVVVSIEGKMRVKGNAKKFDRVFAFDVLPIVNDWLRFKTSKFVCSKDYSN